MIRAGIVGGSGYTGGELIRILLQHPEVELGFVYSTTRAGKFVSSAHPDLLGSTTLQFSGATDPTVDVLFLCLGHGNSRKFLEENHFENHTKFIDLSNDFRLNADASFGHRQFIYGLPEIHAEAISTANAIANPGCFATAIQLALLPLAAQGVLAKEIHINAITGSTGAGVGLSDTSHFSWRNNNISWYKAFTHQHLGEIEQSLNQLHPTFGKLLFMPTRGDFTRGIFATAYLHFEKSEQEAKDLFEAFYENAPFTCISDTPINLKQVVNTNFCHLHLMKHENLLLITSAIDNLLKGASGQAVQNMNLVFGWPQETGLNLKASVF